MTDLRNWYLERLWTWVRSLESARAAWLGGDPAAVADIRRIAHSLRGSGASFGFPDITATAAALEEAESPDLAARTDTLLGTLRDAAAGRQGAAARILLIAGDTETADAARAAGERLGRDLVAVPSGAGCAQAVEEAHGDLIVLDLVLPGGDGRTLLAGFRDHPELASLPVIVVAPRLGDAPRRECLALGADDYLEKPVTPDVLAGAISAALVRAEGRRGQADRDPVTGVWNRAAIAQSFQRLADARPLTLAILDLDDLEALNAARGFEVGNEVMRRAATVVQGTLREHDVMARLRGDEFAILLPRTSAAEAATLLEQAQAHLARTPVLAAPEFHVGFCAGVAAAKPGASLEDATTDAERALYWAKRRGPGSVVSSEQRAPAAARTVVLAEDDPVTATLVKHRLQREGFEVRHFQDGTSALAAADDDVALFILDVKMPGLDGFTLLRQLRANPRAASVPVLMLTAMGREEDIVRGFALGASDYVTKPFSPAELLARIRRLLK